MASNKVLTVEGGCPLSTSGKIVSIETTFCNKENAAYAAKKPRPYPPPRWFCSSVRKKSSKGMNMITPTIQGASMIARMVG